jgi:hypothetical protein
MLSRILAAGGARLPGAPELSVLHRTMKIVAVDARRFRR